MNADLMHDSVIDFQDFVLFVEFSEKKSPIAFFAVSHIYVTWKLVKMLLHYMDSV